jgi:DNA-binding NarL/FixJ family response regulator
MNNYQEQNSLRNKINVMIVDDHPIMRDGLRKLLETESRCRAAGH